MENIPEEDDGYSGRVGDRLRAIRRQKRYSLQDVEQKSLEEFKASVLGAYERGERAISVPRLHRLAAFYAVPIEQLLPPDDHLPPSIDLTDGQSRQPTSRSVTIDLVQLRDNLMPGHEMLARYIQLIQVQRQDFNGRVLTIRHEDLRAIACILDSDLSNVIAHLKAMGITATI